MGYQDKLVPIQTPSYQSKLKPLAAAPATPRDPFNPFPVPGAQPGGAVNALGFGKTVDTLGTLIARGTNADAAKILPAPSAGETAGAALNVGSLLTPVGAMERVGAGALTRLLPNVLGRAAPFIAKYGGKALSTALAGYGFDAAQKLEQGQAPTPGINTAIGAALPLPGAAKEAISTVARSAANYAAPAFINTLIKPLSKQFAYGKNPGRTVSELGITANSMDELAKNISSARNQVGASLQKLGSQVQLRQPLDLHGLISPFDDAITKAVQHNNQALVNRLTETKDAITHIFALDTEGKIQKVGSRLLSNLTYEQGVQLKRLIGDLTKWTGQHTEDTTVNGALTRAYGSLNDVLYKSAEEASPETAAKLRKLNQQYGDLTSAEIATKYRDILEKRHNLINLPGKIGIAASLAAAPFTGGLSTVAGAGASIALDKALSSPAFKTRAAAVLGKVSSDVLPKAAKPFTSPGDLLLKAGARATGATSGQATIGALAGGAAATTAAVLPMLPSRTSTTDAPLPKSTPVLPGKTATDTAAVLDAIRQNETGGVKNPYNFSKFSGSKAMGKDLGAYQVTTAELKSYGKQFLGHDVTPAQFLASPELQDQYMQAKVEFLTQQGLSPDAIFALHSQGLTGWGDPAVIKRKIDQSNAQRKNYVDRAKDTYTVATSS